MAIIKCKMCGGDLNVVEDATVCECEYCGTKQTVPKADDEKKLTLFSRAGRLLRACEFDKAAGVFETIVADFPDEAEAYWGLVLCKYGIEYVDDPANGKKIPTCHRSSFDSVMDDANFEQACENTDAVARRVYRDEARTIEELRQAILQVSGKEEPYDVFISYKETDENGERTLDSVIAQDIYKELTNESYRVFFSRISLEDKLGTEYEPYIFAALNSAKVMIVVGTDYENFDSVWVKNEWSRFLKLIAKGEKKTLIPVFKNMDAYDMPKEFAKLAAQDMGKVGAMQDLVRGVEKLIGKKKTEPSSAPVQQPMYVSNEADAKTAAAVKRGRLALEESNWQRATDYFEQALTLDAECAEAYFGMAMAEMQCRNAEEYAKNATSQTPKQKALSISHDKEHIHKMVEQYSIPDFFDGYEIQRRYFDFFDLNYASTVDGQKELMEKAKYEFESNRNIALAYRFAKRPYRDTLEKFKNMFFSALEENIRIAEDEERKAKEQKETEYRAFLKDKDNQIVEWNLKKQEEQEEEYQLACDLFNDAKTSSQFLSARGKFVYLGDYKDCPEYIQKCDKLIKECKEKEQQEQEEKRREKLYSTCLRIFSGNEPDTIKNWEAAKTGFESLGNYKDASACAEKCAKRIAQIKQVEKEAVEEAERQRIAAAEEAERQRIAAERAEAAKKAKKKRITAVAVVGAVLAIAAVILVTVVIIPKQKLNKAMEMLNSGDYETAYALLEEIRNNDAIASIKYDRAVVLIDSGNYEAAFLLLDGLDYKDSASKRKIIEESVESVTWRRICPVGGSVFFGAYEQDNNIANGKEAIEWLVLEKEKDRIFVISKYALDCQQFDTSGGAKWETCSLRKWLNGTFLNEAFSEEERALVPSVMVSADKNPMYYDKNPGNNTMDQIFLLSITEANKYFETDEARKCAPTVFAVAKGAETSNTIKVDGRSTCCWWLRTPGYATSVAWVEKDGLVKSYGGVISYNNGYATYGGGLVRNEHNAVRPALWINLG